MQSSAAAISAVQATRQGVYPITAGNSMRLCKRVRSTRLSTLSLLQQVMLDNIKGELGIVFQFHLVEDMSTVGTDRFHAQ